MKPKPQASEVFSPIKWERERKRLKILRLFNDRAALPILNREDIISYRLPLHEAIMRKLDKNGFEHSAEYLRQLIEFQDAYRNAAGEDNIIWLRPRLLHQQDILEDLAEGLQKAEKAHFDKRTDLEIDEILKLAVNYCFGSENWWWLGHQLLFMVLRSSAEYDEDRGRRKTIIRYVFGRFLFQNAKEPQMALEHLKIARRGSSGMSWNVRMVFEDENNTIFSESCILIFKIRLMQAKKFMQKDPQTTMKFCEKARKRAMEGCYYQGIIEAHLLKGSCQMMLFDTEKAIKTYLKGLEILEEHPDIDLKCETLRNLAMAYLKHGTFNSALHTMHKLKGYAQRYNKLLYVAQAHKYLGEFYLKEGTARNATPLLMTAVKLFDMVGVPAETAKTRNLAAISVGIELMPIFCDIIKDSDPKFSKDSAIALSRLVRWKDVRQSFWLEAQVSQFSTISVQTMETLSVVSKENLQEFPQDDFMEVEELLGVTGLEGEYSMDQSIATPSNITETISIAGVDMSGNTILPPGSIFVGDEGETAIMSFDNRTSSITEYIMNEMERSTQFSSIHGGRYSQ